MHSVTLSNNGAEWTAKVDAEDASGIASIDVTQLNDGTASDFSFQPGATDTNPYSWQFPVTGSQTQDVSMMFAVTDNAGNTTTVTAKGSLWSVNAHSITASAGAGGSISPSGTVAVNDGNDQNRWRSRPTPVTTSSTSPSAASPKAPLRPTPSAA